MSTRPVFLAVALVLIVGSGCGHLRVGRPPTAAEIAEINGESGDRAAPTTIYYVDPAHPCGGDACVVDGLRPVSNTPPSEIERIAGTDARHLTVVARSGEVWHLDLSNVAGVTTYQRATVRGALIGGGAALALASAVAFFRYELDEHPILGPPSRPSATDAILGVSVVTVAGAIAGAIIGHHGFSSHTYEIGDTGFSFGPPALSR